MIHAPDWIVMQGRRRLLSSLPLEGLIRSWERPLDFRLSGTGQARGYVASWEIRPDETLWLTALQTRLPDDGPDPGIRMLFPDATGPVPATWVYQRIHSPDDRSRRFNPFGNASNTVREMVLWIWAGRLVAVEEFQADPPRRVAAQFTAQLDAIFGSEEAAFLRAIAENPGDTAPRLIYADWLDDRDDPRADTVRLRESLGRLAGTIQLPGEIGEPDHRQVLWQQLLDYDPHARLTRPGEPE